MPHRAWLNRRSPRPASFALLVLLTSLVLTIAATYGFDRAVRQRDNVRFRSAVHATVLQVRNRLDTHVAVLLATRGLFAVVSDVDVGDFRRFVKQFDLPNRYPGIQGIGFSLRIAGGERERVEHETRERGQPAFRVWPEHERDEMHAIVFLEPLDRRNQAAIGYDMYTDEVRREAMMRARDTGAPAASGKVTLVQEIDAEKQAGFLIYVPVYRGTEVPATVAERREALVGFVYSPFRAGDLLADVLGREESSRVRFDLYDASFERDAILHSSAARPAADPRHHAQRELDVAGRTWLLDFHPHASFVAASNRRLVPYLLFAGLAVSFFLYAVARAQVQAQEALRLQSRVLESMNEGVSVCDESGVILYTNPAEDRMFGYQPGELIGQHVTIQNDYPADENQRILAGVIAHLRSHGTWTGEFRNRRSDGSRFVSSARITRLDAAGHVYWVCVQDDITARTRAERERDLLLARERTARAEAEAASRAKDEFLAMLGHELRNPLAPIVTALEIIRLRGSDGAAKELAVIERQLHHVVRLVDDLLDVSRITRGKISLDKQPVDAATVVAKAVEIASPLLEQRRHTLVSDVEHDLIVAGDPVRLAQVVANLLTNAAKFTEPGGHIEISARRDGNEITVRVRDDGIGIAPSMLPRIFEPFTQGERALDRAEGGLGIGLTLVRSLVALHGGTVVAHSDGPGRGTEFVVRLPAYGEGAATSGGADDAARAGATSVASPQTPAQSAGEAADDEPSKSGASTAAYAHAVQGDGERRRVLVVDDNRDAAETLAELLRAVGHDVAVAHDGPQALGIVQGFDPDVAVLDIGLPVMDGYELASRLRAVARARLIAVTGYGQDHDRARSQEAGFDRHLVKPVDPAELLAVVGETDSTVGHDTA